MNVLSLFDGMGCGRLALEEAGIRVDRYFTSEIDKFASSVARYNYPDNIELGDIKNHRDWDLPKIDIIMGGSPCQGFSFAGNMLNFDDPRSRLLFKFVKCLKDYTPKYFLFENVIMKQSSQDIISDLLGVKPIKINSALVSAQNRNRLYWTNIPFLGMPADEGLLIKDIIEQPVAYEKAQGLPDNSTGKCIAVVKNRGTYVARKDKSTCIDANYWKGVDDHGQRTVVVTEQTYTSHLAKKGKDSMCKEIGHANIKGHDFIKRVYSVEGKCPTLTAVCGGNQERKIAINNKEWRKLTPSECEALQTLPKYSTAQGYRENKVVKISNTQRYKMIGNGWTVKVIAHLLKGINT